MIDLILHVFVGAALAAAVLWHRPEPFGYPLYIVLVTFVYAWLREQAQHRLRLEKHHYLSQEAGHPVYMVEKRGFFEFDWVTGHRIWEVFQWVIGSVLAASVYFFFAKIKGG